MMVREESSFVFGNILDLFSYILGTERRISCFFFFLPFSEQFNLFGLWKQRWMKENQEKKIWNCVKEKKKWKLLLLLVPSCFFLEIYYVKPIRCKIWFYYWNLFSHIEDFFLLFLYLFCFFQNEQFNLCLACAKA